jgi:hypothetical protein
MTTIESYENGNCHVDLWTDGTKVRTWHGEARAEFPESVDLKITDYCDAGCAYCHESSTVRGKHAELHDITRFIDDLPRGVELAIGGGDPFSHPQLELILRQAVQRGLVPNITINTRHVVGNALAISRLRRAGLLNGLGISEGDLWSGGSFPVIAIDNNTVLHVIAGLHSVHNVIRIPTHTCDMPNKLLVLGFKAYGRGLPMAPSPAVRRNLAEWRFFLGRLLSSHHVSFDNLAIEQLGVRDWVTKDAWDLYYMGDEGKFSMYFDAVTNQYARSSTSQRRPAAGTVFDMFRAIQQEN